ncbi:efflux RND transporter periplasmic adaptor subunit [Gilvimarinus agarilyticus]|uniref:efflux RND transporter periplasmic adaptor subunit n=1 Tax=Gilvimarinus sp. 2_MG-2023 TaxID=3062666 RepID=UPI001C08DD20|nr:efflux RND transporter periplasmic adaptor subunit [Gilvimarinus sp. 2_MG-2023]MBU2885686.1 efflux RND transporter periplasmic adaptor subunit [Gilvimarinus agarilyticus]MDO6570546.1 efflux RND transporter periplasmic adaptor subunit [Gilvimarinus sp. 2_MG-2023]
MKISTIALLSLASLVFNASTLASDEHGHDDHGHSDDHHTEENHSRIQPEMAHQLGIETTTAGPQELRQTITTYGAVATDPAQLSHVRARFTGTLKAVRATTGDRVKAGDTLAVVESDESFKAYTLHAPIAGQIIQRHANIGESTRDQVLFTIVNTDKLWAELRVYPQQQNIVAEGQTVFIDTVHTQLRGLIQHMIPAIDGPYQLARVELDNTDGHLTPGLMLQAHIQVGHFTAPVAVAKQAVQKLGDRRGVFIQHEHTYTFTPLKLGASDNNFYQVLAGLAPGAEYVSENSYLIKADIEKSAAEHKH